MHIVYLIEFPERLKNGKMPYWYVGVKTNAWIEDDKIMYTSPGITLIKEYKGSSKTKEYLDAINNEPFIAKLIKTFEETSEALDFEAEEQSRRNVIKDPRYFNKAFGRNNFADPEYASYKCVKSGKKVRLRRDDPDVLNGNFVGVTKGHKASKETLKKLSEANKGEKNGFYGKTHSKETLEGISSYLKELNKTSPELWVNARIAASKTHKGVPKSEEQKKKMSESNKGYITVKHLETGKCIRVQREVLESLEDKELWVNPGRWAKLKGIYNDPWANGRRK